MVCLGLEPGVAQTNRLSYCGTPMFISLPYKREMFNAIGTKEAAYGWCLKFGTPLKCKFQILAVTFERFLIFLCRLPKS